jgi:hypothetical protein
LLVGCAEQERQEQVLARVNDQALTKEMVQQLMDSSQAISPVQLQQFANRWVTSELIYQEARQRGIDASDEVMRKTNDAKKQLAIAALLEKEVYAAAAADIRQDEIATYYQTHREEFLLKSDVVWLSVAVINKLDPATEFRIAASGSSGWNTAVESFEKKSLSGLISVSDSIFYSQASLYPPELWRVASLLKTGDVSFPVQTSAGYFVMKSHGQFKAGTTAPLSQVHSVIYERLLMERRQQRYTDFVESLRRKNTIQLYLSSTDSLNQRSE